MNLLASFVFLILTPHTSQSVVRAGNRVCAAGRSSRDFVMFVETVKINEMLRLREIDRELQKIDDEEFRQICRDWKRMSEDPTRERERARRAAHAKQNPGG